MNATNKYGAIMAGLAYAGMERCSPVEWFALTSEQQSMVACDLLDASHTDKCSIPEYLERIGKGNLAKYVKCLEA